MNNRQHPLYETWRSMRKRCNYPGHSSYSNYGGRGISVCERWDDFTLFVEDMGERPDGCTLDREDNDRDYSPENCRWSSSEEQKANCRYHKDGKYIHKSGSGFRIDITLRPLIRHSNYFPTLEEAEDYLADCLFEREIFRTLSR